MEKPLVYVETTIPSVYFETRTSPNLIARREWTRSWWSTAPGRYNLVTSEAVLIELRAAPDDRVGNLLSLLAGLPLLEITSETARTIRAYSVHRLMPANPGGDALHLALASQHKCEFLVTWNCRHLANANKFGHIRRINFMLGLFVPDLVTPPRTSGSGPG